MPLTTTSEFISGMTFLISYASDYELRKEQIAAYENQLQKLQPTVDEAKSITDKIKSLQAENKASEKFLISMNNTVMAHTGQPINNGPLFSQNDGDGASDAEQTEKDGAPNAN